jgi:PAS domain S-box-containing protein
MYHEKLGKNVLVSASPVFDDQGTLEYITHVAKDITEIKESEKDRIRLATAIEQATEAVVITDLKASIQYVNPAFEKLTGYAREEVMGQNPRILSSGKHDLEFYNKMWTTLLQGKVWRGHLINRKKDGSLFEEEVSISPVKNNEGLITNFVAVKRDVSKEMALEKQLQHALKMEAIGTLAGGIAHDFNNILAAIIGYAELIKNEVPADSRVGKDIAEVLAAGQRAVDLVKQILTFSRKTDTEKLPLRPHTIVKEVVKMMEASFPSTIQIETDIDADCGLIMADPTNIHQVTVNLCTNSLHAMADQKGTLSISLQRRELSAAELIGEPALSPGPYVVLTVTDTGCGIDKATMERIFDPFYTTKEVGKGTGLGLAVIHGIVQDSNGFIRLKSTPGEGSSFSVYFPVLQEKTSIAHESDQGAPPQGGNEHILVVDDEPLLVRATQRQLENLGYLITGTTNSRDALKIISSSPNEIDLLITDQTMPGLTGAELAQAAMEIKPDLPVILCTGHSDLISRRKAMESGIKEYITKPLVGDELFRAVRSVLDGK